MDLNSVSLTGRLAADPELKQTQSGVPVCSFAIAVGRRSADKAADFIDCVAWRQNAEFICKYFSKGAPIAIHGTLQARIWSDSGGTKHKSTEVNVDYAAFCGAKADRPPTPPIPGQAPTYSEKYPDRISADVSLPAGFENIDDDGELPF